jgi:hypothetical protein
VSFSGRSSFSRPSGGEAKKKSGRGTGAVKATGSYEGSLMAEGTSGRHEPPSFTSGWSRRPRRLPHARNRRRLTLARAEVEGPRRRDPLRRKRQEATGVSEARSHRSHRGNNTPTLDTPTARSTEQTEGLLGTWQCATSIDPPKRQECRETLLSPVRFCRPKDPAGHPRGESRDRNREHTRYG